MEVTDHDFRRTTLTPSSEPVILIIGRRPADHPASALAVPLTAASIQDDEFQIIADLEEAAEGARHHRPARLGG
ncbi:hypothetical protein [Streptomyces sp. NPDC096324]|uniref:hypothetical protein n=1 Tax=Streptomyces sp. NPDC096324 TaxID=3366085 RepID=UPI0037FEA821